MANQQALEKKITELKERIKALEIKNAYEDNLYKIAKELIVKHNKSSVIFLQRKLMIDLERAGVLLAKLEENGVVGPATGITPRKVLIQSSHGDQ